MMVDYSDFQHACKQATIPPFSLLPLQAYESQVTVLHHSKLFLCYWELTLRHWDLDAIHTNCWNKILVHFASWKLCNEILSGVIQVWMRIHWVSDNNCSIVDLYCPIFFTRNDNQWEVYHLCWWHYTGGLQSMLSKTSRVGNTKYKIWLW